MPGRPVAVAGPGLQARVGGSTQDVEEERAAEEATGWLASGCARKKMVARVGVLSHGREDHGRDGYSGVGERHELTKEMRRARRVQVMMDGCLRRCCARVGDSEGGTVTRGGGGGDA